MKAIFLVAMGGAIGSVLRYLVAIFIKNIYVGEFPWHTFTVNVLGCLVIGFIFSCSLQNSSFENIRLLLMVGILGGFTTFSSFGLEAFNLIKQQQFFLSITYILASNIFGIFALYIGYTFHKLLN